MPIAGNQLQPKEIFVCNIPPCSYQQEVLVTETTVLFKISKKYLHIFMKSKLSLFTTVPQDLTFRLAHQRTSMTASCDLCFLELATVVQVPAHYWQSLTRRAAHNSNSTMARVNLFTKANMGQTTPPPRNPRNFFSVSFNFYLYIGERK